VAGRRIQDKKVKRAQGTVKWFNGETGYGFIAVQGGPDGFAYVSLITGAATAALRKGRRWARNASPGRGRFPVHHSVEVQVEDRFLRCGQAFADHLLVEGGQEGPLVVVGQPIGVVGEGGPFGKIVSPANGALAGSSSR
jgi:CspA family cold shock protein